MPFPAAPALLPIVDVPEELPVFIAGMTAIVLKWVALVKTSPSTCTDCPKN